MPEYGRALALAAPCLAELLFTFLLSSSMAYSRSDVACTAEFVALNVGLKDRAHWEARLEPPESTNRRVISKLSQALLIHKSFLSPAGSVGRVQRDGSRALVGVVQNRR